MAGVKKVEDRLTLLEEQRTMLEAELVASQARKPSRLGWTFGCGPGVAPILDGQGVEFDFVVSCNATWGFRLGGMR